jgi:hypothetical protein
MGALRARRWRGSQKPAAASGSEEEKDGEESKEAEACLSKLPPPCYINALMIAAIPKRQSATLTLMFSVNQEFFFI